MIARVAADRAQVLATLHAQAFDHPWDAMALEALMTTPGVLALADPGFCGFILIRIVADEAEILTLAVSPDARRGRLGRRLVEAGAVEAAAGGAETLFLEVAEDNIGAIALYSGLGFQSAGRRVAYYPRQGAASVDALVLRKPLPGPA